MRRYFEEICIWGLILAVFTGCLALIVKYSDAPSVPNYTIQVIDGCQYLQMHTHNNEVLTHKGDCNNPIHPRE